MLNKLKNLWKQYKYYSLILNGISSAKLLIYNYLFPETIIRIKIAGNNFFIRTKTNDIEVVKIAFVDKEYDMLHSKHVNTIIDAGAHIGTSTIFFAMKYPNAKIIAIEPQRDNFELLKMNVKQYKNIIPLNAAIWSTNESRNILDRLHGHLGYTISETKNNFKSTGQKTDCYSISTIMEMYNLKTIDILKMDIEGGEKFVFEKSDEWINRIETIVLELHERITPGCEKAFLEATKKFSHFERSGEKIIAYLNKPF